MYDADDFFAAGQCFILGGQEVEGVDVECSLSLGHGSSIATGDHSMNAHAMSSPAACQQSAGLQRVVLLCPDHCLSCYGLRELE